MSFAGIKGTAARATLAKRLPKHEGGGLAVSAPVSRAAVLSASRTRRLGETRANAGGEAATRPISDFYCTPWHATRAGLAAFGPLLPPGDIEEPFAGRGDIVKVLREELPGLGPGPGQPGHRRVIASDLNDWRADPCWGIATGVDFLQRRRARGAVLISNPPFARLGDVLRHAGALGFEAAALFLRLGVQAGLGADALRGTESGLGLEAFWACAERVTMYHGLDTAMEAKALAKYNGRGAPDIGGAMETGWFLFSRQGARRAAAVLRRDGEMAGWYRGGLIHPRRYLREGDGRALLPIVPIPGLMPPDLGEPPDGPEGGPEAEPEIGDAAMQREAA